VELFDAESVVIWRREPLTTTEQPTFPAHTDACKAAAASAALVASVPAGRSTEIDWEMVTSVDALVFEPPLDVATAAAISVTERPATAELSKATWVTAVMLNGGCGGGNAGGGREGGNNGIGDGGGDGEGGGGEKGKGGGGVGGGGEGSGEGGGKGSGDDGGGWFLWPQSVQSVPIAHEVPIDPGPPSWQNPLAEYMQSSLHKPGGSTGGVGGGGGGSAGGGAGGLDGGVAGGEMGGGDGGIDGGEMGGDDGTGGDGGG